ncbi:MAG: hypothetical protein EPO02_13800 [Nitrospirae bacterium]|nr:MAG: hypothetical protein EPO02_13800 [Nitrospirota bacterium]
MTVTELSVLDLKKREREVRQEFPHTEQAFAKVREVLIAKLFATTMHAKKERERLYQAVQILDAVKAALTEMMGVGSDDIEKYVEQIAATKA